MNEYQGRTLTDASSVLWQVTQVRNELKNIRRILHSVKAQHRQDIKRIEELLVSVKSLEELQPVVSCSNVDSPSRPMSNEMCKEVHHPLSNNSDSLQMKPIGVMQSFHHKKNGTPRQGCLLPLSRGKLVIGKNVFNNPSHSLQGLELYSHVWIIYFFHENTAKGTHAKIAPPRLNGKKVGVFSSRSPHRPNAIGLTLAKLDRVEGTCLHLSGIDMLDGTPVLDLKPYIPQYDCPSATIVQSSSEDATILQPLNEHENDVDAEPSILVEPTTNPDQMNVHNEFKNTDSHIAHNSFHCYNSVSLDNAAGSRDSHCLPCAKNDDKMPNSHGIDMDINKVEPPSLQMEQSCKITNDNPQLLDTHSNCNTSSVTQRSEVKKITVASWLENPPVSELKVIFNPIAERQVKQFSGDAEDCDYRLEYLNNFTELHKAISCVLSEDPRSTYRRQKCHDRLYFFMVDTAHITAWFSDGTAEVLRVYPLTKVSSPLNLV